MSANNGPIAVEALRGGRVESRHRVSAVVVDDQGRIIASAGDVDQPIYPRSAIKPLQALSVIESGAADAFDISREELALACASHGGEPMHVERVAAWLARLGLSEADLACGPHLPLHQPSAEALTASGKKPSRLHNNCSGKHTGMLSTALHTDEPTRGYLEPEHPVQRRIEAVLQRMTDSAVVAGPAVDGCGAPTWQIPMRAVALAAARLGSDEGSAATRVREAMTHHPELVAGTDRCCTAIMRHARGVLAKTGAEGVYLAAIPARRLGLALKAEDGATRAAEVAVLDVLDRLGALDAAARDALGEQMRPILRNHAGAEVGRIRPTDAWLEQRS